jgi:bacillithiol biosynthesis cysteine-adding enzyme BshC
MTFQVVTTPLRRTVPMPSPRAGGVDPRLLDSAVRPVGQPDPRQRLLEPDALVVTTGQQPGLFTGPLYTIYKAISVAALARRLEAEWRRPVVPVFWLATDDHDFAEANRAAWPTADGSVRHLTLRERSSDAVMAPMYREPLGADIVPALAALKADLPADGFADETMAWLERHYRPEYSVGGAYAGALAELMAPLGVVCMDAGCCSLKQLAAPVMMRALAQAEALEGPLVPLAAELARQGEDPGVAVGDGATLVFLDGAQGRDRLVRSGDQFRTRRGGETYSMADLAAIAAAEPERLSPNVLLRPVVESAVLPTVAYVAGPGELRYLALTPPVYAGLGVDRQLPVARWSGLVVEPRVERVMTKFNLTVDDLLGPDGAIESRIARSQLPESVTSTVGRLKQALEDEYGGLTAAAVSIDPTLEKTVQGARSNAVRGLDEIEKKLVQHLKKRSETELGQVGRARNLVRPDGKPQERVYTVAPFLARYGRDFLDAVLTEASAWYAGALEGAGTRS